MTAICERVVVEKDHPLAELESDPEFCPIEAGLVMNLADNECQHGRLPGDRTRPCGCWPQEPTPPAPAVTKEDALELATRSTASDPEAPFGRFRNGKPRKSPVGSARKRLRAAPEPAVTKEDAMELSPVERMRSDLIELRDGIQRQLDAVNGAIEALS